MPLRLFSPLYWPAWLGAGIMWLLTHLPYALQLRIGKMFGLLLYWFGRSRRKVVEVNIALCFPEKSAQQQAELVRRTFIDNGIGVMETMMAWFRPADYLLPRTHFHGLEKLTSAQQSGRGVLLLGAHYSILDLAGALLSNKARLNVSYRPQDNPVMNFLMERNRGRLYDKCFTRKDIRGFIRTLKQGETLWYAQDQDFGRKNSVFVNFFNVPTATITATSRIAKAGNAIVLPVSYFRREDNSGYDITFHQPLPIPGGDDVADAQVANDFLEQQIRQHPSQYLWLHKRFKTRPEAGQKKGEIYR